MPDAVLWEWAKTAATVDRGSRRIATPEHTGVQKLHHQIATREPQEYHDILSRSTGGAANTELRETAQFLRDFNPKDKKLRGAVNATALDAAGGFKGVPARGRTLPAQPGYQAFHEGFQTGQMGGQLPRSVMQPGAYPKVTPSPMPAQPKPRMAPATRGAAGWVAPAAIAGGIALPAGMLALRRHLHRKRQEEEANQAQAVPA